MCVAVSAVESIDVSGGGGSFRLPRSNYVSCSVYRPTLWLWAVPILAAKLFNQREIYDLSPLRLESYPIFVASIRVAFEYQRWKQFEIVAQQWGMCYVAQFYVHPSIVRAKSYGKATVACDEGCIPVRKI